MKIYIINFQLLVESFLKQKGTHIKNWKNMEKYNMKLGNVAAAIIDSFHFLQSTAFLAMKSILNLPGIFVCWNIFILPSIY